MDGNNGLAPGDVIMPRPRLLLISDRELLSNTILRTEKDSNPNRCQPFGVETSLIEISLDSSSHDLCSRKLRDRCWDPYRPVDG